MLIKTSFLILALLVLSGCQKAKRPKSIITRFDLMNEEKDLSRSLASSKKCFKDRYTVEDMKLEITELEKKYKTGKPVTGTWKHIDLSKLPIPQANLLNKLGLEFGDVANPKGIDYSSCKDVICIYNKVYEKDANELPGYVHYLWYLKMGTILAADNVVHEWTDNPAGTYNKKEFPLSAFLYEDNELYGFWRLSHVLELPFNQLAILNEIQRIPNGEFFTPLPEEEVDKSTCGEAWSHGYINLRKSCLSVESDLDRGFLYEAITHELSHQVDFKHAEIAGSLKSSNQFSYYDLAGFSLKVYEEDGVTVSEWNHKEDAKFISDYAKTNPAENFAETMMNFKLAGDKTKSKIKSDLRSYFAKKFFSDKYYETLMIFERWLADSGNELSSKAMHMVSTCSQNSSTQEIAPYFNRSDFKTPVPETLVNCLGLKMQLISLEIKEKLKYEKPEGCVLLSTSQFHPNIGIWESVVKSKMLSYLNTYLLELSKDKDYFVRIKEFSDNIEDKTMAIEAFVSCYHEINKSECYQKAIYQLAHDKASELALPLEQTEELALVYVNYHRYEIIKEQALRTYQIFVNSHQQKIDQKASELWEACHQVAIDDALPPSGKLFTVGDGYLVSSIYNCINSHFPSYLKGLIRSFLDGNQQLQHPNDELILDELSGPQISNSLKKLYLSSKAREASQIESSIPRAIESTRSVLKLDLSWVSSLIDPDKIQKDCSVKALSLIPIVPRYHLKGNVYSQFVTSVCMDIGSSAEFHTLIESSKGSIEADLYTSLETKILVLAGAHADKCLEKNPATTQLERLKLKEIREQCLLSAWGQLEEMALKEISQNPTAVKFGVSRQSLSDKLALGRRRLQIKTIKDKKF